LILHITHNDLDGAGCAILIKKCFKMVNTAYLNYDEVDDYLEENYRMYDKIIITDVTPSLSKIEKIGHKMNLTLIDHHKSTEVLKKYDFTIHSLEKSATLLTYEWLISKGYEIKDYESLAYCINDYDLWIMEIKDSLKMNMLFTLIGIGRYVERFVKNPSVNFTDTELYLLEIEEENQEKYILQAVNQTNYFRDEDGNSVAVVFAERYNSELGNYLVINQNVDYVIIINAQKNKISLRSKPEVDISGIAVNNGGGGHKNAAGFSTDFDFCLEDFLFQIGVIN
jgi:oligoribonuclease NrnB/cAMP/cGMP phosphodiesterase (DHH superfamily)